MWDLVYSLWDQYYFVFGQELLISVCLSHAQYLKGPRKKLWHCGCVCVCVCVCVSCCQAFLFYGSSFMLQYLTITIFSFKDWLQTVCVMCVCCVTYQALRAFHDIVYTCRFSLVCEQSGSNCIYDFLFVSVSLSHACAFIDWQWCCRESALIGHAEFHVPYSRKYWWELNLAVEPQIAILTQ